MGELSIFETNKVSIGDINATATIEEWRYGNPVLEANGNGKATWQPVDPITMGDNHQVTWAAKLDAGRQTNWDDFAKVSIPVNELPMLNLNSVRLMAYYTATVGMDIGVCLWMHDPTDFDKQIQLTHTGATTTAAGWRELNSPTDPEAVGLDFFWYGDASKFSTPTVCVTEGGGYTWAQFQSDPLFNTWTIYKITLNYGYIDSGGTIVMNGCYLVQCVINGTVIQLEPSVKEQISIARDDQAKAFRTIPTWTFGDPILTAEGNAKAEWDRGTDILGTNQKGSTGWVAKLTGGAQSGHDDAASVTIPVNELPLIDFTAAKWTYYLHNAQLHGCNIGIHVHDPTDNDKRADINQSGANVDLTKEAGWNAHELNVDTVDSFFYYGEHDSSTLTAGTTYSLATFQADPVFSTWTIYRITINQGYYTGDGVFGDAVIGDIELNGQVIPLKPSKEEMWYSDHLIKNDIPMTSAIYTPRRIHVTPVFANYDLATSGVEGSGRGHLIRAGYGASDGGGVDVGVGYAAMLESGSVGSDVSTWMIPVNIPLNKIDTVTYYAKMQDAAASNNMRGLYFKLDVGRTGAYMHTTGGTLDDLYLVNYLSATTGATSWELVNPLTDTTWQLKEWHTLTATPDGTITGGQATRTFAHFKATDLGDYYVKQIGIAYTGLAADDWGMVTGLAINGVEYIFDLNLNQKIIHRYIKDSDTISTTIFPRTPFKLISIDLHASAALAGTNLTITKDAGMDTFFDTVIYSYDVVTPALTSFYKTFEGFEAFAADDKLTIAQSNTGSKDVGIDVAFEIL